MSAPPLPRPRRPGGGPAPVVVEGRWAVEALLDSPLIQTREVFIERGRHAALRARLDGPGGPPVRDLEADEMETLAGYAFHRGVFATAERPAPLPPPEEILARASRLLVPVDLADPGNLGALVRSAAAFGADGVIQVAGRGADIYSRKCLRASATALFRIPVFEVASLPVWLERLREAGFVLFATSLAEDATVLPEARPAARSAVLVGPERDGLPTALEALCDERIRVPMGGGVESLNAAAAGSVVLWELFARRGG